MKEIITSNAGAILLLAVIATVLTCVWLQSNKLFQAERQKKGGRQMTRYLTPFSLFAKRFMVQVQEALYLPRLLWRKLAGHQPFAATMANVGEQVHAGAVTRLTDAAITTRYLLVKKGTDAAHIAVSGAGDHPIGVCTDEASAAEVEVDVALLGAAGTTLRMVASEAIGAGVLVYAAASGKVATTGTVVVGTSLTAVSADDDIIEVASAIPLPSPGIAGSLFDAHTMLYATTDNTPAALTIAASRIVGRKATGNIIALTGEEVRGITDPITYTHTTSAADSLAIPITHRSVRKTTGADAEALTLADGAFLGQKLHIVLVTDGGGDGTLTPTTPSGFATIVFADAGDSVDLEWTTGGWILTGSAGVAAPPVITV